MDCPYLQSLSVSSNICSGILHDENSTKSMDRKESFCRQYNDRGLHKCTQMSNCIFKHVT